MLESIRAEAASIVREKGSSYQKQMWELFHRIGEKCLGKVLPDRTAVRTVPVSPISYDAYWSPPGVSFRLKDGSAVPLTLKFYIDAKTRVIRGIIPGMTIDMGQQLSEIEAEARFGRGTAITRVLKLPGLLKMAKSSAHPTPWVRSVVLEYGGVGWPSSAFSGYGWHVCVKMSDAKDGEELRSARYQAFAQLDPMSPKGHWTEVSRDAIREDVLGGGEEETDGGQGIFYVGGSETP